MIVEKENIPLIRVEDLKKYYPVKGGIITHTTGYVKAVDGVSFSVMRGQTLGLVGESGCGKSTIGRQLVGLEIPTEGKIYYDGVDLTLLQKDRKQMREVRTKLQMIFQDPYSSLNPRKHIYEILAQPMLYHRIASKDTVEKEILRLLDMVGLPRTVLGRYPHEFSGGQRQRIGIARALSLNPEFIVCDEPVSALDVSIQAQILNLLKELQKELGLTLLFVGHGLGAVNYVSDQIAVMYLGNIVEVLPAEKLNSDKIGTEHLLIAIIKETESTAPRILSMMEVNPQRLYTDLLNGIGADQTYIKEEMAAFKGGKTRGRQGALAQYTRDLTAMAAEGKLDPVFCRDAEIERVIQILTRRTKNTHYIT